MSEIKSEVHPYMTVSFELDTLADIQDIYRVFMLSTSNATMVKEIQEVFFNAKAELDPDSDWLNNNPTNE